MTPPAPSRPISISSTASCDRRSTRSSWFRAPRTFRLLLTLLKSKALSGRQDPSSAYLALWARHLDSGIVEITNERELAYEAGYTGNRALRTWQERMRLLESLGLIKAQKI